MLIAITREVGAGIVRCELTHLERLPIDLARAKDQHHRYEECLAALGCEVRRLPDEPDLPDAVFVEDAAVVLDEIAVITRPGAESRRAETASVAGALEAFRPLGRIEPPGTLDGGDLLRVGKRIFIGRSGRSNRDGIDQMRALARPLGYDVEEVPVHGCLHLKSAVTQVGPDALLIQRKWVDPAPFTGLDLIDVDPGEPFAANALLVGGRVVHPAAYPRTRARLEARGIAVRSVDVSELAKAEGSVTCCSLILEV